MLGFLHDLLVDHFDILPHAVAIPPERVFGHRLLVRGCQSVAYGLFGGVLDVEMN